MRRCTRATLAAQRGQAKFVLAERGMCAADLDSTVCCSLVQSRQVSRSSSLGATCAGAGQARARTNTPGTGLFLAVFAMLVVVITVSFTLFAAVFVTALFTVVVARATLPAVWIVGLPGAWAWRLRLRRRAR